MLETQNSDTLLAVECGPVVMIYLNSVSMNNIGLKVQGLESTLVIIFRKFEKHDPSYVENYTHTHTITWDWLKSP